jgi:arylsulfatase
MGNSKQKQPNILVIWGDDIGITNLSCYSHGLMGYQTPNIDRIAREGMLFTDAYGEQSCTAGRSSFITGQSVYRTGLSKVGFPGAPIGMNENLVTIAALLKEQGYATGQFGKNHLGDLNHMLPTNHGFDEFFGNLYHLNAEEEPEMYDYPPKKDFPNSLKHLAPEVLYILGPRTEMIQPKCHGGEKLAGKKLRIQDRLPQYEWKPAMTNLFQLPKISFSGSMKLESHFSCGSIRHICTYLRIPNPQAKDKKVAGSLPIMIR